MNQIRKIAKNIGVSMSKRKKQEINQADLVKIQGRELKYNQLCKALNMPIKNGYAKTTQLADLEMYCQLERLSSPTRFAVKEVYDGDLLEALNGHNKYQALFEAALYQALINNHAEQLCLSNMEMLEMFEEVNENFRLACNKEAMSELGEDYIHFADMGQTAYKILKRWTQRRLKAMETRGIIITRRGYRLYSETPEGYIITTNVQPDSELEQTCQEIYNRAVREIMPQGWAGEWVGLQVWFKFESKIKKLTAERFDEHYIDLKPITIISPPREQYLREQLKDLYTETPELKLINNESCRKILETTQLDKYTTLERKRLVDISIKQSPRLKLKQLLNKEDEN